MSNHKKILLTRELHEFVTIRHCAPQSFRSFCANCASEMDFLTLDAAVSFGAVSARRILFEIEEGAVHAQDTASGHLIVCRRSLEEKLKEL